jgi:hypothetical protein
MKVWNGYGSEHSSKLIMIGHFKAVLDAAAAKQIIDRLTEQIREEVKNGMMSESDPPQRLNDHIMELFREVKTYILAPAELLQFYYDISVELNGDTIIVTTDEYEVSAFMKILIDGGARVEVFSRHDYPAEKEPGGA